MAAPKIVYKWVTIVIDEKPARVECHWSLVGGNGEHMCGSYPEGYRDKTDARRAVQAAYSALCSDDSEIAIKEVGPGPRPK